MLTREQTTAEASASTAASPLMSQVLADSAEDSENVISSGEEDTLLSALHSGMDTGIEGDVLVSDVETTGSLTAKPSGGKRKGGAGPTPPFVRTAKRPKRQSSLGTTFEEAEKSDRLGVIIVRGEPYKQLTPQQLDRVRSQLMSEMATAIEGGIVPRFMESGRRHGRFHLSCVDHASFSWLKMTVDKLSVRSDSGVEDQLLLVTPSQLPRLLRAEVYVSGKPPTVAQFKTFLQAQKDGLHTERWALRHQHTTTKGMLMV